MKLGFHVSIRGSIDKAVDRSVKMGINTFQIFTRNPRSWKKKNFNNNEISNFIKKVNIKEIDCVVNINPDATNSVLITKYIRDLNRNCKIINRFFLDSVAEILEKEPFNSEVISSSKATLSTLIDKGLLKF